MCETLPLQLYDQAHDGARIDGLGCTRNACRKVFRDPSDDEDRGGVKQDDVASRASLAAKDCLEYRGVRLCVSTAECSEWRVLQPKRVG